jgi:hemolysin activation/secretion protein
MSREAYLQSDRLSDQACFSCYRPTPSPDDQFIIQQQRQKALEQQLTPPTPDVRLSEPASGFGQIPSRRKHPAFPSTAWR